MTTQFILSPIAANTKGTVKRLRLAGFVPVSLQHQGMKTLHYQQETKSLDEYLRQHGEATLLDLLIGEETNPQRVMVQNVERDPVSQKLRQVIYRQVRRDDALKTQVPLLFTDEPKVSEALLQHRLDRLEIECSQSELPDHITVSLGAMHLGSVLRVSDLPSNAHYKILTPGDTVLASLMSNRTGSAAAVASEAAPAA